MYSMDVLRLNSSKTSLDHLSSSMIFAGAEDAAHITTTTQSNPTRTASPPSLHPTDAAGTRFVRPREGSRALTAPWVYPFPIHTSLTRVSILIDDTDCGPERPGAAPAEERDRKQHACPTCMMRFRRPSSLRTHLNSHTGATRE